MFETSPIGTVRELYDGVLTSDLQVNTLRHGERLFPVREVRRGTEVRPLAASPGGLPGIRFTTAGETYDLVDYMALNRVTGLLVLKNERIAYEHYALGNTPATRWLSMSLVKTLTAALVGAAIRDGFIQGIGEPVQRYLPRLAGTAYDGVTIAELLRMTSGVRWDETYTNPLSDRRRMLDAQLAQRPGAILDLMATLPHAAPPGSVWNYSTGETHVAGALVAAAVGTTLSDYLSRKVWAPCGMEASAFWWLESPDGAEIGGSGLSASLRDYGRVALFLMSGGVAGGEVMLPPDWMRAAASSFRIGGQEIPYGYMTWPFPAVPGSVHAGAFQAIGIFGQHLYMHPAERVAIVVWGAQPKPNGKAPVPVEEFFAAVVTALR